MTAFGYVKVARAVNRYINRIIESRSAAGIVHIAWNAWNSSEDSNDSVGTDLLNDVVEGIRDIKIAAAIHGYTIWTQKKHGLACPVWRDKSSSASQCGECVRLVSGLSEALNSSQCQHNHGPGCVKDVIFHRLAFVTSRDGVNETFAFFVIGF